MMGILLANASIIKPVSIPTTLYLTVLNSNDNAAFKLSASCIFDCPIPWKRLPVPRIFSRLSCFLGSYCCDGKCVYALDSVSLFSIGGSSALASWGSTGNAVGPSAFFSASATSFEAAAGSKAAAFSSAFSDASAIFA